MFSQLYRVFGDDIEYNSILSCLCACTVSVCSSLCNFPMPIHAEHSPAVQDDDYSLAVPLRYDRPIARSGTYRV